jgi:hypothetical protein
MPATDTKKTRVSIHADGVVHVHVSPKALFNFDEATRIHKEVLGRLGHGGCTSGFDIRFVLHEQEFGIG